MLHSPGIVYGYAGDLRVNARARGDLSVEVQPGYAIDGMGNDLMIFDATIRNINLEEFRLPQTIYIVLRYYEELTDFIAYKENLEYKGHRRVLESCKVELSQTEPDITREVELARIYLEKGVNRIRDARDPANPQANEIDMRYVQRGGLARLDRCRGDLRLRLEQLLMAGAPRRDRVHAARRDRGARRRAGVQHRADAVHANLLDLRNVFDIFKLIVDTEGELSLDVDVHHPTIAQKKEFSEYRRQVEILRGLLAENKNNAEAFQNLLAYQAKCAEIAMSAVAGEKPVIDAPEEKKEAKVADIKDWEGVKAMPAPKPQMDLEGITWVLVDEIEILNKESEDKHIFHDQGSEGLLPVAPEAQVPGRHDGRGHRPRARRRLQRVQAAEHHAESAGGRPAPDGLRLRRLRARDVGERQEGRRSCPASAPTASTAGATGR